MDADLSDIVGEDDSETFANRSEGPIKFSHEFINCDCFVELFGSL